MTEEHAHIFDIPMDKKWTKSVGVCRVCGFERKMDKQIKSGGEFTSLRMSYKGRRSSSARVKSNR